jgi:hypothetical protein
MFFLPTAYAYARLRPMALSREAREYFANEGKKGGKARAANLSAKQRKESARRAAQARWAKAKKKGQ